MKQLGIDGVADNDSPDATSEELESVEIGIRVGSDYSKPKERRSTQYELPLDQGRSATDTNGYQESANGGPQEKVPQTLDTNDNCAEEMDSAMKDMANSFRDMEECLDQLVMEGRQITLTDLGRLNRLRDAMDQNSKVALRTGREICRLAATSSQSQPNRSTTDKARQSQDSEPKQMTEVRILSQRLEKLNRELEDSQRQLEAHRAEVAKFGTVNESLESLKAHLQRELRQRESECERLNAHIHSLESKMAEERAVLRTQLQLAEDNLMQMRETKEALKRAARAQRKRADEAEAALSEALNRLNSDETAPRRSSDADRADERPDRRPSRGKKTSRSGSQTRIVREMSSRNVSPASARLSVSRTSILQEESRPSQETGDTCEQRLEAAEREVNELRGNLAECASILVNYRQESEVQAEKLRSLTEELREVEEARGRSQDRLNEIEQRLYEAEAQNRALLKAVEMPASPGRSEESPSNGRASGNGQSTRKRSSNANYEQEPNKRGSDQTELIEELRKEIVEAKKEREQAEYRAERIITDLRAQLSQSDATNHSLQAYLTFLKRSYASVFQPVLTGDTHAGIMMNGDSTKLGSCGRASELCVDASDQWTRQ
ncbi:unnamed protein product [Dicrocoelium dendriticum]|nr:unnamed protein product [Dicrocoelium dendriticum]